ncbi:hypothetical protein ACSS7Z_00540 [Microbacterium sp. A82]|uniref:hypothetical protein n=1 Tax=Microbacterium sp. A82 TaxID=3450452 RepID=UPI003F3AEE1F
MSTLADAGRELRAFREGLHAFAHRHAAVAIGSDPRAQGTDSIQASLWAASRDGLDATLIDPETDALASARDLAALLLRTITPALEESGDLAFVQEHLDRVVRSGNGAQRQRTAYAENGIAGLRSLGCAVALPGETEAGETMTGMPGTGVPGEWNA